MTGGVQQTGRHFQGLSDDGTTALLFIYFGIWSFLVLVKSIWNVICQEFFWVDRGRWGLKKPTGSKVWEPLGSRNENFTTGVISWKKIKNWLNAFNIHLQTLFSWVNPGSHGDLPTTTCFSIRDDDYFPETSASDQRVFTACFINHHRLLSPVKMPSRVLNGTVSLVLFPLFSVCNITPLRGGCSGLVRKTCGRTGTLEQFLFLWLFMTLKCHLFYIKLRLMFCWRVTWFMMNSSKSKTC